MLRVLAATTPGELRTVVTIDDRADPRGVPDEFAAFAASAGLDLRVAASGSEAKRLILELRPDICFVCGWYWLFDPATIAAVPRGLIGMHNSLLPKYRGGSPLVWALINGEPVVGTTIFEMSEGIDDGRIFAQYEVPVGPEDAIADVLSRLEQRALGGIASVWQALLDGTAPRRAQDAQAATWCGQRSPDDGRIDWTQTAARIYDFVRAQSQPYPGAFTEIAGKRIHILRARPFAGAYFGTPGQVLRRTSQSVLIACGGDGALEVLAASEEGVARPVRDIFASMALRLR